MMIHVRDVDEVDGVDGWLFPVGADVIEVVVIVPQDSAFSEWWSSTGWLYVWWILESIEE